MPKVSPFFTVMKLAAFFGAGHYGDIFNNQRQMENVKKENWNKLKWSTM